MSTGSSDLGGTRTTLAMQQAEALGIAFGDVTALLWEIDTGQVKVEAGVFSNIANLVQSISFKDLAGQQFATGGLINASLTKAPGESLVPQTTAHLLGFATRGQMAAVTWILSGVYSGLL